MLGQVSRLSDGDYEQSMMVQLFLDCVDRTTASSTAFVSFREQPMHFNDDNQKLNLREVDPTADEGVRAIIDDVCNSCCTVKFGDKMLKQSERFGPSSHLAAQKGNYFQQCWDEHDK